MREEAGLLVEQPTPPNWLRNEDDVHAEFKRWIDWAATYTLKEYEYYIVPGQDNCGKGDLLLEKVGEKTLLVVEAKYIKSAKAPGTLPKTLQTSRTKGRKKVREQALRYACLMEKKYPDYNVVACIYTNERGLQSWNSVSKNWIPFPLESEPQDLPEGAAKGNFKRKLRTLYDHDHGTEPKPKKCAVRLCFVPWQPSAHTLTHTLVQRKGVDHDV